MSALAQKQTCSAKAHVRFTPESGHVQCNSACLLCANRWGNRPRKPHPAVSRSRIKQTCCGMRDLCRLIGWTVVDLLRSRAALEAEIWTLRQQINVLRRAAPKKLSFSAMDRLIFVGLYRLFPGVCDALAIVKPDTIVAGIARVSGRIGAGSRDAVVAGLLYLRRSAN